MDILCLLLGCSAEDPLACVTWGVGVLSSLSQPRSLIMDNLTISGLCGGLGVIFKFWGRVGLLLLSLLLSSAGDLQHPGVSSASSSKTSITSPLPLKMACAVRRLAMVTPLVDSEILKGAFGLNGRAITTSVASSFPFFSFSSFQLNQLLCFCLSQRVHHEFGDFFFFWSSNALQRFNMLCSLKSLYFSLSLGWGAIQVTMLVLLEKDLQGNGQLSRICTDLGCLNGLRSSSLSWFMIALRCLMFISSKEGLAKASSRAPPTA